MSHKQAIPVELDRRFVLIIESCFSYSWPMCRSELGLCWWRQQNN